MNYFISCLQVKIELSFTECCLNSSLKKIPKQTFIFSCIFTFYILHTDTRMYFYILIQGCIFTFYILHTDTRMYFYILIQGCIFTYWYKDVFLHTDTRMFFLDILVVIYKYKLLLLTSYQLAHKLNWIESQNFTERGGRGEGGGSARG